MATWWEVLTYQKNPQCWERLKQEANGKTEDEIVGWQHRPDEHESEQDLGVGDGQGNLEYCTPWYRKELDMTERLNWTNVQKTSGSRQKSLGSSQACGPGGSGERFRWRGRIPILLCRCLNPRQGAQDFEYVTKFFFLTKQNKQTCFLQEWELWLSLFSRFYWGMWKESGVGWVCKN